MDGKQDLESYPLKSLHDFLTELDKEWDRFRTASLIGIITSGILLIFVVLRFLPLLAMIRRAGLLRVINDLMFLVLVLAFIIYEISLLLRQYKFFKKWERRVGLLLHLEERLMEGMMEERMKERDSSSSEL